MLFSSFSKNKKNKLLYSNKMLMCFLLLCSFDNAFALSKEYKIKSAYILNIIDLTFWPAGFLKKPNDGLLVCMANNSEMSKFFQKMIDVREVDLTAQPIKVIATDFDRIGNCDVIYLSDENLPYQELRCKCLIIGDSPVFNIYGSDINFYEENNRVRIEINVDSVKKRSISFSSNLMEFARLVTNER